MNETERNTYIEWMESMSEYSGNSFDTYQQFAISTAIYKLENAVIYPALGLAGETGEVVDKIKKILRDGRENLPEDWNEQIAKEMGDALWYFANLAHDIGYSLSEIAAMNVDKLTDRKKRGVLSGSGDNR